MGVPTPCFAPLGRAAWADEGRRAAPLAWPKRVAQECLRFVVVHASQLAQPQALGLRLRQRRQRRPSLSPGSTCKPAGLPVRRGRSGQRGV